MSDLDDDELKATRILNGVDKEIEVGEYVRDNEGNIDKIINTLSLFKDVYLYLGEEGYQYSENAISKHSKNIIDLIEVRRCS